MRWERKEVVVRTDLILLEAVWHVALELSAASDSKDEGKAPGPLTGAACLRARPKWLLHICQGEKAWDSWVTCAGSRIKKYFLLQYEGKKNPP